MFILQWKRLHHIIHFGLLQIVQFEYISKTFVTISKDGTLLYSHHTISLDYVKRKSLK